MSKASARCPSCDSSFSTAVANAGKKATCPKCKQPFIIQFEASASPKPQTPPSIGRRLPRTTPTVSTKASQSIASKRAGGKRSASKEIVMPMWAIVVIPTVVALIVGYFAGREHLKYQVRNAVADAFTDRFQPNEEAKAEAKWTETDSAADADNNPDVVDNEEQPDEATSPFVSGKSLTNSVNRLTIGQTHAAEKFSIVLVNASIEKPQIKDLLGDTGVAENPDLVFEFKITNTDDRRILRFREANMFMENNFRLRDDVDNVIRGVSYGVGAKPVGALTGSEDIAPGASANHIELFSVPPPKTEFLILTVNLESLGGEGEIEIQIPANQIKR